jgi:futalosine hydrolase
MKLLIVAATQMEIAVIHPSPDILPVQADILITGVGMVATAYCLTKRLQQQQYDLVLQVGVCGSFDQSIPLGTVVYVNSDRYGDLGAEDHDNYLDIFDMGLMDKDAAPHTGGRLVNPLQPRDYNIDLPQVSALTVNTVSGNRQTIARRAAQYGCTIESMEGAAFHYVCLQEGVTFAQVRGISNYVTPRDKSQWRMKDAIIHLNNWLIDFIDKQ